MLKLLWTLAIGLLFTVGVTEAASSVTRQQAEGAARGFCRAIVARGVFSYWDFSGRTRHQIAPLLSRRLLAMLDNIHECGRDWARQQPPNSTDKPPFVDCCIFSDSPEWSPTSFVVKGSRPMPDGRRRIMIEYRFDSSYDHARWHIALYIARERGRYVVDDFEGSLDDPDSRSWFVSEGAPECTAGKWSAPK